MRAAVAEEVDPRVARELWSSFVAMIRAYTAAHGLNGTRQAVLEVGDGRLLVRAGDRRLQMSFDGARGEWRREEEPAVPFTLDEQGRVVEGGRPEEMDMVAERLAREIMR